jgi:hypothetical protein
MSLSEKPLVYTSAQDLWKKYARDKFLPLKTTTDINAYYDFILAGGAVGNWLYHGKRAPNDIYFKIFMSIYNNIKHFKLDKNQESRIHISQNLYLSGPIDESGNKIWDDDAIWDDDEFYIENVHDIEGEYGAIMYYCEIEDPHGNPPMQKIYLYEICRQVYGIYENISN